MKKIIFLLLLLSIQTISYGQKKSTPSRKIKSEKTSKNVILDILKRKQNISFQWNINNDKILTTETILSEEIDINYRFDNDYSNEGARISSKYCDSIYLEKLKENRETILNAEKSGEENYLLNSMEYIVMWKDFNKIIITKDLIAFENKTEGHKETFKAILNKQKNEIIQLQNINSKKIYELVEYIGSSKN